MKQQHNYFVLKNASPTFLQSLFFIIKMPFSWPSWVMSFLIARTLTNITLNPTQVKKQKPIHHLYLSDDSTEKGTVIINLLPDEPRKAFHDYLLKFNSAIIRLPFLSGIKKRQLKYDNPKDKAHIERVITEINALLVGKSRAKNCAGKRFDWDELHFKGFECLDDKLRAYFLNQLYKKHGENAFNKPHKTKLDFFTLETPEGAVLDSVAVPSRNEEIKPISQRKFVIACMARDQNYINWIKDFKFSAEQIGCTIIGFNYRGIDISKGMVWTQENMINDVLAQVGRLLAMGAKPENIGLEGMCLGAAVATIAAARLHDRDLKIKLYNERSFRSLPRFIAGYILPDANCNRWNPVNWLRYLAVGLVYMIVVPCIWLAGWHMDAASAWDKIPQADKAYSVIRNSMDADPKAPKTDGVVEDSWASMASLMDEKRANAVEKQQRGERLTHEEKVLLADVPTHHHFKVGDPADLNGKLPHHLPRRHLIQADSDDSLHMHQHMVASFKHKFGLSRANANAIQIASSQLPDVCQDVCPVMAVNRPLLIANSGGVGHISAMMGIIDSKQKEATVPLQLTLHQAQLYSDRPRSIWNFLIRTSIYFTSVWIVGKILDAILGLCGYPRLPRSEEFWAEMSRLEKAEIAQSASSDNEKPVGRMRPYVDMLLDIYPFGYEATAINNSLHRMDRAEDITLLAKLKNKSEIMHYKIAYDSFLSMLINAAEKGEAYTEIISTQPLSLAALCDAVREYNEHYVDQKNELQNMPSLPHVAIHQYMTDLPSLGCDHFLDTLSDLTPEQRQQMHLYAVNLTPDILLSYLDGGRDFKGIHGLLPSSNPMVRAGFKDRALEQYLDKSKSFKLKVKTYPQHPNYEGEPEEIEIPAGAKVATIHLVTDTEEVEVSAFEKVGTVLLSSLASDATVSYVKHLLDNDYDKIFVFGGLNDNIYHPIEAIIRSYPVSEQDAIRGRIIRLGNQSDVEMGPIMTRSDCVVIRGGGLSVMEQMALPENPNKTVLFHHHDSANEDLTSGLSWEDGNVDRLIEHLQKQGAYARKTSPIRASDELRRAKEFHLTQALRCYTVPNPILADRVEGTPRIVKPIPMIPNHHSAPMIPKVDPARAAVEWQRISSELFKPIQNVEPLFEEGRVMRSSV